MRVLLIYYLFQWMEQRPTCVRMCLNYKSVLLCVNFSSPIFPENMFTLSAYRSRCCNGCGGYRECTLAIKLFLILIVLYTIHQHCWKDAIHVCIYMMYVYHCFSVQKHIYLSQYTHTIYRLCCLQLIYQFYCEGFNSVLWILAYWQIRGRFDKTVNFNKVKINHHLVIVYH